ncbi:monovalent cation/H+ antiporter subunit D [Chitinimonas sp. BJB300]|uniref:monovalent cation/H+ antiporter subunit D n=1 Tax=Chitinimonas sp. BJB300 TaxID=1559339 RepID=UPI000C0F77C7|nr:monovalent cation/H+ antiporter subunit D [Chitinimonas sp. BJB300]PHV12318.1 monovalent cation/H+ antiporter subunit D [Chitinimonas sp. BJB300]TSJ90941.1 monovalent cation/H+ antiporter subunit D [Chitinimonas sp. BJB300]
MSSWPHWIIAPVVLPLLSGSLLLYIERQWRSWVPNLSLLSMLLLVVISAGLFAEAGSGRINAYLLSNWHAPFGIVLVLDRLSALLVGLTSVLALACLLHARGRDEQRGAHFHSLVHFQLMGLNGAFLTGDLFNLFVFFEVLLISSYGLLLHGAGAARLKASIHYVSFNLAASALFLIAVSLLYGLTGTLNMADLALRVLQLGPENVLLAQSAALLLLVVFAVKAALLPLYFWLPDTYGSATASVAALFAIMTKVGVYAIARVFTLIFGVSAGALAEVAQPWLVPLAMVSLLLGALGALAARQLRGLIAYLLIASAGTLLLAIGVGNPAALAAGLYYLPGSTLACAALFLLLDQVVSARGVNGDVLQPAAFDFGRHRLGLPFFICALVAAGLPPLSGFLGKALLLRAALSHESVGWIWAAVLMGSLLSILALARAGSVLFWASDDASVPCSSGPLHAFSAQLALWLLIGVAVATGVLAGPFNRYCQAAATQLFGPYLYIEAVMSKQPVPARFDVRKEMREAGLSKGGAQ